MCTLVLGLATSPQHAILHVPTTNPGKSRRGASGKRGKGQSALIGVQTRGRKLYSKQRNSLIRIGLGVSKLCLNSWYFKTFVWFLQSHRQWMTFTGGEGISNLHACAYYRTSHCCCSQLSALKPSTKDRPWPQGPDFFFLIMNYLARFRIWRFHSKTTVSSYNTKLTSQIQWYW